MKQPLLAVLALSLLSFTDGWCADTSALISVKLAIPLQAYSMDNAEKRTIHYPNYTDGFPVHFPVIITNVSDQPQRIMQEGCSGGYDALSFEFTDENGKTLKATKQGAGGWTRDFPAWSTLQPKESLIIDVYYASKGIWNGMPHPPYNQTQKMIMRAVFEMKPFGRVVSEPLEVVFRS